MKIKKNNQKGGQPPMHRNSEEMRRMREERMREYRAWWEERERENRARKEERERASEEEDEGE